MKALLSVVALAMLAACGVETATTAATSAEIKKREMDQAKQTMDAAKQKIEKSTQQILERTSQAEDKAKD